MLVFIESIIKKRDLKKTSLDYTFFQKIIGLEFKKKFANSTENNSSLNVNSTDSHRK
jgi:hypothetical protein